MVNSLNKFHSTYKRISRKKNNTYKPRMFFEVHGDSWFFLNNIDDESLKSLSD